MAKLARLLALYTTTLFYRNSITNGSFSKQILIELFPTAFHVPNVRRCRLKRGEAE